MSASVVAPISASSPLAIKNPNAAPASAKQQPMPAAATAFRTGSSTSNKGTSPTQPSKARPIVISVEAAIGTGKSSLLRLLQSTVGADKKWIVVQEPVDQWRAVDGKYNLLDAYYSNQERFAFSFQTNCVLSRIRAVQETLDNLPEGVEVVVLERCWASDRNTFAEMLKARNKISDMEWALYDEWYNFACRNAPTVDGHLYLHCSTETCMQRLRRRDRSEEVGVTADYQQELIRRHEDWLVTLESERVCRVEVDQDFINDGERSGQVLGQIKTFVSDLAVLRGDFA